MRKKTVEEKIREILEELGNEDIDNFFSLEQIDEQKQEVKYISMGRISRGWRWVEKLYFISFFSESWSELNVKVLRKKLNKRRLRLRSWLSTWVYGEDRKIRTFIYVYEYQTPKK